MFKCIPEWISRITIGWVFIESGIGKLQNLDKVTGYFESLHIPLASIQAPFVSCLELGCGLFILLGIFPRLASLPLMGIMVVAIRTAKWEDIKDFSDLLATSEFLYIVILLWLAAYGTECLSLGRIGQRFLQRRKM
jgi:putative oxidoreductase